MISTDPNKLDFGVIHRFLRESYWAKDVQFEKVKKSCDNSLCFGVYEGQSQVGFARVVTDYSRFAYLADVFILTAYRRKGLANWLMQCIMSHPELQGLTRWLLATADAHGLYEKSGFKSLEKPEIFMERKTAPDL